MPGQRDHQVYCGLHAGACILMDCDGYKFWPSPRFKTGHAAHGGCDYQENVSGYNNILGDVHCNFVIVFRREHCIVLVQPSHYSIMFGDFHSVVRGDFPMAASAANSPLAPLGQIVEWTAKPSPFSIQGRHGLSEFFWIMAAKTLKNPYRLQTVTFSQRHVRLHSQENGLSLKQDGVLHGCSWQRVSCTLPGAHSTHVTLCDERCAEF